MHPEINTLEDWNARLGLCGCCQMPVCPLIQIEGEHDTATLCFFFDSLASIDADLGLIWLRSKNVEAALDSDTGWTDFSNPGVFEVRAITSERLEYTLSRDSEVTGATTGLCPALEREGSYTYSIREQGEAITGTTANDYDYTLTSSASSADPASTLSQWWGKTDLAPGSVGYPGDPFPPGGDDFFVTLAEDFFPISTDALNDLVTTITVTRAPSERPQRFPDGLDPAGDWDTATATYTPWLMSTANDEFDDYTPTYGNSTGNLSSVFSDYSITVDSLNRVNGPTSKRFARYRWAVPAEHEGTWFRVTWDTLFIPDEEGGLLAYAAQEQTWEWNGEEQRQTDWYTLLNLLGEGIVALRNIRFECYRGPYGGKPQVLGELADVVAPAMVMTEKKHSFHQTLL